MSTGYEPFRMPEVRVGTVVLWYPGGVVGVEPLAAIVTRVHARSVAVSIVTAESHNFLLRDGCRHVTDPELRREPVREEGAWDFTERDRALERLLGQVVKKEVSKT